MESGFEPRTSGFTQGSTARRHTSVWEGLVSQGEDGGLCAVEGGLRSHLQGAVREGVDATQAWSPSHLQLRWLAGNQVEVAGPLREHCGEMKGGTDPGGPWPKAPHPALYPSSDLGPRPHTL